MTQFVYFKPYIAQHIYEVPVVVNDHIKLTPDFNKDVLEFSVECSCGADYFKIISFKHTALSSSIWKSQQQFAVDVLYELLDLEAAGWKCAPASAQPHICPACDSQHKIKFDSFMFYLLKREAQNNESYYHQLLNSLTPPSQIVNKTQPAAGAAPPVPPKPQFLHAGAYITGVDLNKSWDYTRQSGADREQFMLMERMLRNILPDVYDGSTMPDTMNVDVRLNLGDIRKLKKFIVTEDDTDVQDT